VTPESESALRAGDRVTLSAVEGQAEGLVIEVLDDGLARVEWIAGKGIVGNRTVHAARTLRKLPVDAAPRRRYLRGTLSDLDLLDKYLATQMGTLPFDVGELRHALAQRPVAVDGDVSMGLPLWPAVAEAFTAWLAKDAQRLTELGQDTMSALLRRITVDP
jgi:hypothetical protein